MRIAEAAEVVLRDATAPMHVREIASAVETRKLFEFRAADKGSVVSKALKKGHKFVKVSPGVFSLRQASVTTSNGMV